MGLKNIFSSAPIAPLTDPGQIKKRYTSMRWSVFLSATLGYGLYYVCRLSLNVIKKPIVLEGILSESELGIVGSALFISYALGKLANGFLADRVNIRLFFSLGLLVSALVNLILGFTTSFTVFVMLWAVNGWAQSIGSPASVVGLTRWFSEKQRGTYYGFWSASHNIGEAITFIVTAVVVSSFGWRWGFTWAGLAGMLGALGIFAFMRTSPARYGLPPVNATDPVAACETAGDEGKSVGRLQMEVLKNPLIWLLAFASAFMYVSRYAVNSWGIFYLEFEKGYTNIEAGSVISISSVCGILGTVGSGWVSDRFFGGRRYLPAVIFGAMNVLALALFLFGPKHNFWVDAVSMVVFGLAIGALICYLGGLMATDIASKKASGFALGVVGMASYAGAAFQDLVSGFTIEGGKRVIDGVTVYDFSGVTYFWLGAAALSLLLSTAVWYKKRKPAC